MASPRRERTRQKLIRAAMQTVARRGFEGASVDAIAERAGLSIGSLYSNFKGKDDLFFAVFDEHLSWFAEQVEELGAAPDLGEALVEWMQHLVDAPNQFLVFVEFWSYAVRRAETRRQLAVRLAEMRARVTEVLGDEDVALFVVATVRGLALEKLADSDAVPNETLGSLPAAFGLRVNR